tara:strand:- start:5329 stop:5613 length:285 start_codon:yes stop_codon:yes gene_type:complete
MRSYRKKVGKKKRYQRSKRVKSKQVKSKRKQLKKTGRSRTRRRRSRVKRGGKWAGLNLLHDAQNSTMNSSKLMDIYNGVKNTEGGTTFSTYGRE